jgi:hypothetical protein
MSDSNALLLCGALLCIFLLFASAPPRIEQTQVNVEPLVNKTGENINMPFTIRSGQVSLAMLKTGNAYYIPTWRSILSGLGLNMLRLSIGQQGDSWGTRFTPDNPNWATNLLDLLDTINPDRTGATGFKVWWQTFDGPWGGQFSIDTMGVGDSTTGKVPAIIGTESYGAGWYHYTSPGEGIDNYRYDLANPAGIAIGKIFLDKLAGEASSEFVAGTYLVNGNSEAWNFLADPRIVGWTMSNECYYGTGAGNPTYDWTVAMFDYIHSKGGKTIINCPLYGTSGWDYWNEDTVPLFKASGTFGEYADYIEVHHYSVLEFVNNGRLNNVGFRNAVKSQMQEQIDHRGTFTVENIILGEVGIHHGYSSGGEGLGPTTFSDDDCRNYWIGTFQALEEVGWKSVSVYSIFETAKYQMIYTPGGYTGTATLLAGCEEIKGFYITDPDPVEPAETLPWTADFTDTTQFTVQQGDWSVAP